jgi:hypothetical protein
MWLFKVDMVAGLRCKHYLQYSGANPWIYLQIALNLAKVFLRTAENGWYVHKTIVRTP